MHSSPLSCFLSAALALCLLEGGGGRSWGQTGEPVISASPARGVEGNSGLISVRVPVYLSAAAAGPVSVAWTTVDGTAVAGTDYEAGSGTVTFAPGEVEQQVVVRLMGDTADEGYGG